MENSFVLIVLLFAALATGGLVVNWIGLGRAMSRLSVSAYVEFHQAANRTTNHHPTHKSPHQPSNRVLVIQNPPQEWAQVRARWIRFHAIRTLFSVPAFAVYVLAAISNTSR